MEDELCRVDTVKQQKADFEKLVESLGEASLAKTKALLAERDTVEQEESLPADAVARLKERIESGKEENR